MNSDHIPRRDQKRTPAVRIPFSDLQTSMLVLHKNWTCTVQNLNPYHTPLCSLVSVQTRQTEGYVNFYCFHVGGLGVEGKQHISY